MTQDEFIKEAENFIYKEVAKTTNLLFGKNKTAGLSTGLFLKLPIVITVEKSREPLPTLYKELETFMPYFAAYTNLGNTTQVFFTFMYHSDNDLKKLWTNLQRRGTFLAFVYMHELQHIIRKHITKSYSKMMLNIAGDMVNPHQAINIAEDYAINYSIKDLFLMDTSSAAGKNLAKEWPEIEEISMYKKSHHDQQMSDITILKEMKNSPEQVCAMPMSDFLEKITYDGKESLQPIPGSGGEGQDDSDKEGKKGSKGEKVDKCSTVSDDLDTSIADLAESIQDIIRSNTKGTAVGEKMNQLFDSIKVETGWFKKIKASFKRQVFYKTHEYTSSWANLNNTYRRIYKAPKKQFLDDKISIILSVDHSGSMATEDLQKLLYLVESEAKKISKITVLIHDYDVTKSFELEDEYDITKSADFKEALSTRHSAGGTSHKCVFEYIQDMKLEDPNKVIYMCFSDMESDIESTIRNYPIMRKLTNYWVSPTRNNVDGTVPGTAIAMV